MSQRKETKTIEITPKELDSINKQELTVEDVRAIPKFATYTDEQAQEIINSLKELAGIAYKIYENQLVISKKGTDIADKKIIPLHESRKRAA